ncbi:MAG: sigma-70 family RNA polymerase sigma factor [Isosphaeraceae bacterium]
MAPVGAREEAAMPVGGPGFGPETEGDPHGGADGDGEIPAFLERIRAGDEDAARDLLTRYEAEVRLVVRRQLPRLLRSRFDSLDFLQSVWGSFFRRVRNGPSDFEDSRHLVAFLARAAKNKVIDEYRRAASRKQDMSREEPLWVDGTRPKDVPSDVDSPSEVAQANEAFGRLRDLLPEERRTILELKAQGLSSREIGDRLSISERTVQRVLEDLRRKAEAQWQLDRQRELGQNPGTTQPDGGVS